MGRELVFQLTQDGQVNGIDGVLCQHVGRQWEIAVPKDKLPIYNKTISFGLYLSEPFVKDVANLKDDGSNDSSDGNYDIAYDGYMATGTNIHIQQFSMQRQELTNTLQMPVLQYIVMEHSFLDTLKLQCRHI